MSSTQSGLSGKTAHHLSQMQCSRQWRGFLQALADEFTQVLSTEELHELMARVGVRFATAHPLEACHTLPELQRGMTGVWRDADWGWVTLEQRQDQLSITHHCAPLLSAMDESNAHWSLGFLQGAYQQWFDAAGAGSLRVAAGEPLDSWGSATFSLSR